MKKNFKRTLFYLFLSVFLVGCKDAVAETFGAGEYIGGDFLDNFYGYYPPEYSDQAYTDNETVIDLDVSDKIYSYIGVEAKEVAVARDYKKGLISDKEMKEYFNVDMSTTTIDDVVADTGIKINWIDYARYYNLANQNYGDTKINTDFKTGYFSKMTDGLINCFGFGSIARIQTHEAGFGARFNHELIDYTSIMLSLRGATNIDYSKEGPVVTSAKIDLNLSFYIEPSASQKAQKVTFKMPIDDLFVDAASQSNVIYFHADDLLTADQIGLIKRASGVSFSYKLKEHGILMPSGIKDETRSEEFAVMFYELMLPHSSWR